MAGNRTLKLSILADVDDLNKKLKAANGDVENSATQLEKFGKVAGAAFLAAAAAAGAYAVKIGVDGVKAALADEQSQVKLASALENATGATKAQIAATEDSIDKMARATGVADDQLRPALARLALSTGNVSKAQDLLSLALDISTQTGKPLEGVANALGKAYDGNTAALGKLGVGLSSAELKAMSFTEVQTKLSDLFGGAAEKNAATFQGRMDRLKIAFDEGVEAIGYKLLPIIETLVSVIVDKVVPNFEKFISFFDPIKQAIDNNKEAFLAFGKILADYVAPVLVTVLGGALKTVGSIVGGVVNLIGNVAGAVVSVVNGAISAVNALIAAYNKIPVLPDIPLIPKTTAPSITIPKVSGTSSSGSTTIPKITVPSVTSSGSSTSSSGGGGVSSAAAAASSASSAIGSFNAGSFRAAEVATSGSVVNITVNGALDKEGTARQIVEILNDSSYRGGGGSAGALIA